MKFFKIFFFILILLSSLLTVFAKRILLIPLDDRPACLQLPIMIGKMANIEVVTPPKNLLGNMHEYGQCEEILSWFSVQDLSKFDAVILSTDMLLYGGLVASRNNAVQDHILGVRLKQIVQIRNKYLKTPFYAFSTIMRIAPTKTSHNSQYYENIRTYLILQDRSKLLPQEVSSKNLALLKSKIPSKYLERTRNQRFEKHKANRILLESMQKNLFDYLIIGQDDAALWGPHRTESAELINLAKKYNLGDDKVYFAQGADQYGSVLVSRAILKKSGITPKILPVFSDQEAILKIPQYESRSIYQCTMDQIIISGAEVTHDPQNFQYKLYVNIPTDEFSKTADFQKNLELDIDKAIPVAMADTNFDFSIQGTQFGDIEMYLSLCNSKRMMKLLSYASWNTASNTLGTTIPAANAFYVGLNNIHHDEIAQSLLNHYKFMLHRMVDDYGYHTIVRNLARQEINTLNKKRDMDSQISEWQLRGSDYELIQSFVANKTTQQLKDFFDQQLKGLTYNLQNKQYQISLLKNIEVTLPWPRTYEQFVDFDIANEA